MASFIFTLKNAEDTMPQRFALKPDHRQHAICCGPEYGPAFGGGHDFFVCTAANVSLSSHTNFGHSYSNEMGYDGKSFLAGEYNFLVKELEVFAVEDWEPDQ
jgi:hypothetical protein